MLRLAAVLLLKPGESDRLTGQNGSKIFTVALVNGKKSSSRTECASNFSFVLLYI